MSLSSLIKTYKLFGLVPIRTDCILKTNFGRIFAKHYSERSEDTKTLRDINILRVRLKDQTGNILGIKTLSESKILAQKTRMNLIEEKQDLSHKYRVFKLVSNQYLAQMSEQSNEELIETDIETVANTDSTDSTDSTRKSAICAKSAKEVKRLVFSAKLDENDLITKINGIKRWLFRGHQIAVQVMNTKNDSKVLDEIYNKFETDLKGIAKLNQKKIKTDNSLKFMILPTIETKEHLNANRSSNKSINEFDFENLDPKQLLSEDFEQELNKK